MAGWKCPKCKRAFTRKNQRHACGTGDRAAVLKGRPPELVAVYAALEAYAKSLGPVEVVARERYALFRGPRIFADVVMMTDAVRLAVHLGRKAEHPAFFKVVADRRQVTHVAKLRTVAEAKAMLPHLKEAYGFAVQAAHGRG